MVVAPLISEKNAFGVAILLLYYYRTHLTCLDGSYVITEEYSNDLGINH